MTPVTVVLADDHTLFREGVREMLETSDQIEVLGEAANGNAAIQLVVETTPDVLVLDVEMPGPGAAAVIGASRQHSPALRVIVLTMHDDPSTMRTLLAEGAAGYLAKSVGRRELISAVLATGGENVLISVPRRTASPQQETAIGPPLSAREREVVAMLPLALTNSQIARRLQISEGTVKRHLTNIYRKLDAVSRIDAIAKAATHGLIDRAGG